VRATTSIALQSTVSSEGPSDSSRRTRSIT
jgi:hypothetical protein